RLRDDPELPSRVTRRASAAFVAFIGNTKETRNARMGDEGYRKLWGRVQHHALARTVLEGSMAALETNAAGVRQAALEEAFYGLGF
ncbi:hypothetical protein FRB99_008046, partial [Tulasnella sp. 403]